MTKIIMLLFPLISFAQEGAPVTPTPIFLKEGFSTVLEFDELPSRVVLGDSQSFQVERLEKSIVIRTLEPYAVANLFVYFKKAQTKLFLLTASEDAEPTFYKNFKPEQPKVAHKPRKAAYVRGIKLVQSRFDAKKDHLHLEIEITADSKYRLLPQWDKARLIHQSNHIKPKSLWSERQEVQRDSAVKARIEFLRPNLPKNLKDVRLVLPLKGWKSPMTLNLGGGR